MGVWLHTCERSVVVATCLRAPPPRHIYVCNRVMLCLQGAPVANAAAVLGGSVVLLVPRPADFGGRPALSYLVEAGPNIVNFIGVRSVKVCQVIWSVIHSLPSSPPPHLCTLLIHLCCCKPGTMRVPPTTGECLVGYRSYAHLCPPRCRGAPCLLHNLQVSSTSAGDVIRVMGLTASTTYFFRASVVTAVGTSPVSAVSAPVRTGDPSAPSAPSAPAPLADVTASSGVASWQVGCRVW
jgi:hypothetical protein